MKILTYHVVPTKIQTSDVYNDKQLDTLNGDKKIRINEYTTVSKHTYKIMTIPFYQAEY